MFSKSTEYALRAVIFIAQKSSESNKLIINTIATGIGAPQSFTAKILQQLRGCAIICAVSGPNGGFYITEKQKERALINVLNVMGEDSLFSKCVLGLKKCSDTKPCPMHHQYQPVKQNLLRLFSATTIGQLAAAMQEKTITIRS